METITITLTLDQIFLFVLWFFLNFIFNLLICVYKDREFLINEVWPSLRQWSHRKQQIRLWQKQADKEFGKWK